jgi:hypothetical protein
MRQITNRRKKIEHEKIHEEEEQKRIAREAKEVDFDFTEEEFVKGLRKLVVTCYNFDTNRQQWSTGPSKAFQGSILTPSEFREMVKRVFNLKLSPGELGALVTYFDPSLSGIVNCNTFIQMFIRFRVQTEGFKVCRVSE